MRLIPPWQGGCVEAYQLIPPALSCQCLIPPWQGGCVEAISILLDYLPDDVSFLPGREVALKQDLEHKGLKMWLRLIPPWQGGCVEAPYRRP